MKQKVYCCSPTLFIKLSDSTKSIDFQPEHLGNHSNAAGFIALALWVYFFLESMRVTHPLSVRKKILDYSYVSPMREMNLIGCKRSCPVFPLAARLSVECNAITNYKVIKGRS